MVQALRAAAALAVALHHVTHDAASFGASDATMADAIRGAMPWEAGVDIFFVISGFVMLHASETLFESGLRGVRTFAAHRIARIVPLYWVTTSLFLLALAADPHAIASSVNGIDAIFASYAFIPFARADGSVQPVYSLGWTLNYEMFFYLWFATCLWMPRKRALVALTLGLGSLVAFGLVQGFADIALKFWSYQIVLEFLIGLWLCALRPRLGVWPDWVRGGLVLVALAALHADGMAIGVPRVLAWGVPAALLVLAAVTGRQTPVSRVTAVWVRLGDASYALYLLHPFVIRAGSLLWRRLGLVSPGATLAYIAACLALSCLTALIVNAMAEKPVTRWLRRRLEPAQSAMRSPVL
jgi:peptidoglycan/LPS O-acetylase OafA/YrhL